MCSSDKLKVCIEARCVFQLYCSLLFIVRNTNLNRRRLYALTFKTVMCSLCVVREQIHLCCSFPEGGGSFGDSDLVDVSGGDYKPDGGKTFLQFDCPAVSTPRSNVA